MESEATAHTSPVAARHPVLAYSLARLCLFLVAYGALWLTGLRNQVFLVVLAALASGIVSMWLLARPRDEVSRVVTERLSRFDEHARAEDVDDEPRSSA